MVSWCFSPTAITIFIEKLPDYSSCDAKKSQDSKIVTNHDCDDSSADSNSQGKNANSTSEHASANGNATIEEQDHDSYSKDSSASENGKKSRLIIK